MDEVREPSEGVDDATLRSRLSLVSEFAVSLREKHVALCQTLEEEHLDQAIEQEVSRAKKISTYMSISKVRACRSSLHEREFSMQ